VKRNPINAKRSTARRVAGRDEHGPGMVQAREETFARSGGRCEFPGCSSPATDAHHRLTRRYGPDCPCNLLALCSRDHHESVHGNPNEARGAGWIVSRHATDPGRVPVQIDRIGIVLLPCEGGYRDLAGHAVSGTSLAPSERCEMVSPKGRHGASSDQPNRSQP
jgi:hypothetical protein